jgi:hypothetical protein
MSQIKTTFKIKKIGEEERFPFCEESEIRDIDEKKLQLLADLLYLVDRSLPFILPQEETVSMETIAQSKRRAKENILNIIGELYV